MTPNCALPQQMRIRLATLGFKVLMEGKIKAYVKEHGEFVVYADPRPKSEIVFSVHVAGPKTKKKPRWIRLPSASGTPGKTICRKSTKSDAHKPLSNCRDRKAEGNRAEG